MFKPASIYFIFPAALYALMQAACYQRSPGQSMPPEDSRAVFADAETRSVSAGRRTDAADDPAIWIHPSDPDKSLVIGTNKVAGLSVYDLQGEEIHFYPLGRANNVDVRYGFTFGDKTRGDIVACTERDRNEILLFRIRPDDGSLSEISGGRLASGHDEIYGCCMYRSLLTDTYYAISNDKSGKIEQWALSPHGETGIQGRLVRTLQLSSQPEGMVADDELAWLYVGEETEGVWKFPAEPDHADLPVFVSGSGRINPAISFDLEGLAIYYASSGKGYLIASSQGNNSYAVFAREGDNRYLGSFHIADSLYDGTSETDGLDVTNLPAGYPFSKGWMVVQDGVNTDGRSSRQPQNFKLVSWEKIARLFEPALLTEPGYSGYVPDR